MEIGVEVIRSYEKRGMSRMQRWNTECEADEVARVAQLVSHYVVDIKQDSDQKLTLL